jgi:hypothetical protein
MKHAKWLLLVAVGILMVLPGCKSMSPVLKSDVRIAEYTQELGSWPLMAGKDQFQIGDVYMYWQYDYFDPELYDPEDPTNNDAFVNLALVIKCETYSPDYPITDANLNISTEMPTEKGSPGHYNFNDYLAPPKPLPEPCYTVWFVIPVADLETVPWQCGDWLWFLVHVAAGDETAFPGEFVPGQPGGHGQKPTAWFNRLHVECINPEPPDEPQPPEYREETAWGYNIVEPTHWFWALGPTYKWGGVIPYTLGGRAEVLLWAGAGQNDPAKGTIVGTVTVTDDVDGIGDENVYVHYVLTGGCLATEAHAGADIDLQALSDKSHKFAPGQLGVDGYYPYPWEDDFTLLIPYETGWTGSFVVAAHAAVLIPIPGEVTAD